jgi:YidC/Oxa1 family membrane protein insertase
VVFERDGHNVLPAYLTFEPVSHTDSRVELIARPANTDVEVRRVIKAHTDYAFLVTTEVINHGAPGRLRFADGVFDYVLRSEEESHFFRQPWQRSEGMCEHDGRLYREWREKLGERSADNDGIAHNASFVGVGNLYILHAIAPLGPDAAACHLRAENREGTEASPRGSVLFAQLSYAPLALGTNETHAYRSVAYFGPKFGASLSAAAPQFHQAINLGYFAIIARGLLRLLQWLHGLLHNWGLAIIVLTVIARLSLFPVLARSIKSMAKMQKLAPEMTALREKFKDDQQALGLAQMELYRREGVNPFASCLPQLAQLPIWWALWQTLQSSVELFHAPFCLWWRDLSAPDPYFVLPIIYGGLMYINQRMMPAAVPDPAQQKMMLYFMPLMLTGISLFLPSGLALYMLVSMILGIVQQRIIKAQVDRLSGGGSSGGSGIEVRPTPALAGGEGMAPFAPDDGRGGGRRSGGGRRGGRR